MPLPPFRRAAPGPSEGSTGGGNGMIAYGFKGGTGTASRLVTVAGRGFTLGALVQANHGIRPWLTVLGRPVGRMMPEDPPQQTAERGSIIASLAPMRRFPPLALRHLARRASLGVARGGTPGGNSSGDIFLAFSVANPGPMPDDAPPLPRAKR